MNNIEIYIDLDFKGKLDDGIGKYSIVIEGEHKGEVVTKEHYGGYKDTSKNRFALLACIDALKYVKRPCNIIVHINSPYAVIMNDQMKRLKLSDLRDKKNMDLLEKYYAHMKGHDIMVVNERETCYNQAMKIQREIKKFELVTDYREENHYE